MINSAKDAREAIKIWDEICEYCAHKEIPIPDDEETTKKQMVFLISKGYLAALEGPEVKAFVNAIDAEYNDQTKVVYWKNVSRALREYHEAVKP